MALLLACLTCGTAVESDTAEDPHPLVVCPPGSGCCTTAHHHGDAASACPRGHQDAPCPAPGGCQVFPGDGCAGGHCGRGVPGCTVCRPISITVLPGHVRLVAHPAEVAA